MQVSDHRHAWHNLCEAALSEVRAHSTCWAPVLDAPLHVFPRGLGRNRDAVIAAPTLPYDNGPAEGVKIKTKRIARQMHGRAASARPSMTWKTAGRAAQATS